MKIKEIAQVIFDWNPTEHPCPSDKIVFGDENADAKKVAVCCIVTCDVVKKAKEWGADLIITHEPTYPNYKGYEENDPVAQGKKKLIEDAGIPIYRFHDSTHFSDPDRIIEGVLKKLEWRGSHDGHHSFVFDRAKSVDEIKSDIEEKLELKHIRICGTKDNTVKKISMCVGAWGDETVHSEIVQPDTDAIICGEITEWRSCEYVRDAAQLGMKKTMFLLGHMGSEREGMKFVCDYLTQTLPELEYLYIDCGEVYS